MDDVVYKKEEVERIGLVEIDTENQNRQFYKMLSRIAGFVIISLGFILLVVIIVLLILKYRQITYHTGILILLSLNVIGGGVPLVILSFTIFKNIKGNPLMEGCLYYEKMYNNYIDHANKRNLRTATNRGERFHVYRKRFDAKVLYKMLSEKDEVTYYNPKPYSPYMSFGKVRQKRNSAYADKYEKELYEDEMWDE